jgi:hypothetical protein
VYGFTYGCKSLIICPKISLINTDVLREVVLVGETEESLDSSVGIATGYGLKDGGVGVRVSAR